MRFDTRAVHVAAGETPIPPNAPVLAHPRPVRGPSILDRVPVRRYRGHCVREGPDHVAIAAAAGAPPAEDHSPEANAATRHPPTIVMDAPMVDHSGSGMCLCEEYGRQENDSVSDEEERAAPSMPEAVPPPTHEGPTSSELPPYHLSPVETIDRQGDDIDPPHPPRNQLRHSISRNSNRGAPQPRQQNKENHDPELVAIDDQQQQPRPRNDRHPTIATEEALSPTFPKGESSSSTTDSIMTATLSVSPISPSESEEYNDESRSASNTPLSSVSLPPMDFPPVIGPVMPSSKTTVITTHAKTSLSPSLVSTTTDVTHQEREIFDLAARVTSPLDETRAPQRNSVTTDEDHRSREELIQALQESLERETYLQAQLAQAETKRSKVLEAKKVALAQHQKKKQAFLDLEERHHELSNEAAQLQTHNAQLRMGLQAVTATRENWKMKLQAMNDALLRVRQEHEDTARKLRAVEKKRQMELELLGYYRELAHHCGYFKWGKPIRTLEAQLTAAVASGTASTTTAAESQLSSSAMSTTKGNGSGNGGGSGGGTGVCKSNATLGGGKYRK